MKTRTRNGIGRRDGEGGRGGGGSGGKNDVWSIMLSEGLRDRGVTAIVVCAAMYSLKDLISSVKGENLRIILVGGSAVYITGTGLATIGGSRTVWSPRVVYLSP